MRRQLTRASVGRALAGNSTLVSLVVLFVVLSFASSAFLHSSNLRDVLQTNAAIGIVACAGTLVVVAGGVDFSVGAIYAVAGVISAKVGIASGVELGIVAGAGSGLALGVLNGLVVTKGGVNPFVATLASAIIFGGFAEVLAGQQLLTPTDAAFGTLGRGSFLGLKYSIWIFAATALVLGAVLSRGRVGREIKAVGANPETARLSGISIGRAFALTYAVSGAAAGLVGVIIVSQSGQAKSDIGGFPFVLSVIAAVAVGGARLSGGQGSIGKTVIGVLFLGLVTNGLALLGVDPLYNQLVLGLIILVAIGFDGLVSRGPAGRRVPARVRTPTAAESAPSDAPGS
jgi:ribose transport system permease protein